MLDRQTQRETERDRKNEKKRKKPFRWHGKKVSRTKRMDGSGKESQTATMGERNRE